MSGAIFRTDLSWPAIVADELGFTPRSATRPTSHPTVRAASRWTWSGWPASSTARRARPSAGPRCSGPPGGSAATWTRSRTTGSGGRAARSPPTGPVFHNLAVYGWALLDALVLDADRLQARIAAHPPRDNVIDQLVENDNDRAAWSVAQRAAGGRRDGPHRPGGRGRPRRGGRRRSARDRDPGRHARRQQRARRGRPPGRLLELGRLPGPDRRRAARGRGLVHRVPALALRGRLGRAGRGDPRHPGPPRDRRHRAGGDHPADHPRRRDQGPARVAVLPLLHAALDHRRGLRPATATRTSPRTRPGPSTRPSTPTTRRSSTPSGPLAPTASTGACSTWAALLDSLATRRYIDRPATPGRPGGRPTSCRRSCSRSTPCRTRGSSAPDRRAAPTAACSPSTACTRRPSATGSSPRRSSGSWTTPG